MFKVNSKKTMNLHKKITLMIFLVIICVTSVVFTVAIVETNDKIREKTENGLIQMAIALSKNPTIINNIGVQSGRDIINKETGIIRDECNLAFITVTDMDKIRYSHTDDNMLGKKFSNNNIDRCINTGDIYTDEGMGTKGLTVKAFAPIIKKDKQIGVVCVGVLKWELGEEVTQLVKKLLPIIGIIVICGFIVAAVLAKNVKKSIYGLEPEEIASLLSEREAVLNNIEDGLIAINLKGYITVINEKAIEILKISENISGESIIHVDEEIYNTFNEILDNKKSIINITQRLKGNLAIVGNYSLIKNNEIVVGASMTFKSMNEMELLIDELSGIKELNWNLRAQNHEFLNKLHTIFGLIQLERYDDVINYISDVKGSRTEIIKILDNLEDRSLAALLLAKYNKANDKNIIMNIDSESKMDKISERISTIELGSVVGNIIDNSIDALEGVNEGVIDISITDFENLSIEISNNGPKIDLDNIEDIFKKGISTKGENRGLGLYNVKRIIDNVNGKIKVTSTEEGVFWSIEI